MEKREFLKNIGFDHDEIDKGNCGFEIEDMEGYFARETAENRLAQGLEVPDEYHQKDKSQDERDMYRRMKCMERIENTRTQEDKSSQWGWTDRDQLEWEGRLIEKGYGTPVEGRVTGSIREIKILTKFQALKRHQNRWLSANLMKRKKKK